MGIMGRAGTPSGCDLENYTLEGNMNLSGEQRIVICGYIDTAGYTVTISDNAEMEILP